MCGGVLYMLRHPQQSLRQHGPDLPCRGWPREEIHPANLCRVETPVEQLVLFSAHTWPTILLFSFHCSLATSVLLLWFQHDHGAQCHSRTNTQNPKQWEAI